MTIESNFYFQKLAERKKERERERERERKRYIEREFSI